MNEGTAHHSKMLVYCPKDRLQAQLATRNMSSMHMEDIIFGMDGSV